MSEEKISRRVIMLSDERISLAERLDSYAGSLDHELQGDLCSLMYDAADAIRAALAEAAQVPVMGEAAGWLCKNKGSRWFTESEDRRDIHISAGLEVTPLFEKPTTCITQAELERLREKLASAERERDQSNARLHEVAVACATAERERDDAHEIIDQYKGMAARYKVCMDERDALRKDAARYRWLRDGEKSAGTGMTDEAIDAAMQERQS